MGIHRPVSKRQDGGEHGERCNGRCMVSVSDRVVRLQIAMRKRTFVCTDWIARRAAVDLAGAGRRDWWITTKVVCMHVCMCEPKRGSDGAARTGLTAGRAWAWAWAGAGDGSVVRGSLELAAIRRCGLRRQR